MNIFGKQVKFQLLILIVSGNRIKKFVIKERWDIKIRNIT